MYQTKWRMMWTKIYWSGVYNELIKLSDPLKDLLKDLIIICNIIDICPGSYICTK